ncbi:MAG: bifunctional glutamate N-acetyltransferase/amino-acid acetyltransferase ArgJ [Candidatus Omnitrophota bacterium]|nr:bifunctional glutamate N-acetyltransferase/amino-acid acetyltransferase ArgJ [Candidatus Omnitrophota bacterium]
MVKPQDDDGDTMTVNMKIINGGVTAPRGFKASGINCGLKKKGKDLALIYSDIPAEASALFTTNKIQAAPVKISKKNLKHGLIQAILINSGNANSCTGKKGLRAAGRLDSSAALKLGIKSKSVLLASTGIIGKALDAGKIEKAMPELIRQLSYKGSNSAGRAIMTTDTVPKQIALKIKIKARPVTIGAIAKGAGMISPKLATMLVFIATDVNISNSALTAALKESIANSFNLITVDGDMSTNDTVFILANGLAGNPKITRKDSDFYVFQKGLNFAASSLAKMIVKDGEGVTKFIEVIVKGGQTKRDTKNAAFKIANSLLVKTALGGNDPNWGRVVSSLGSSGANLKENLLDIYFDNLKVLSKGRPVTGNRKRLKKILSGKEVTLSVDLNSGKHQTTVWTGDLSSEYIRINRGYGKNH